MFSVIVFTMGIPFLFISLYLFLVIFLGSFGRRYKPQTSSELKKFTVVIPAHNEEKILENSLRSILDIDYPRSCFDVYVIADNCSDQTAAVAKRMGVCCLERFDAGNMGKGYALQWFFDYTIENNFLNDIFLIIDADTIVSRNILKEMNTRFCQGAQALNCRYDILHHENSATASISCLGLSIRNLRNNGLSMLGGSAQLLGNGMAFRRDIIEKYRWSSISITEDIEQWAILYLQGVTVNFVYETSVYALMPETFKDFSVPRTRWDIGSLSVNKRYFFPFLKIFLRKRDPRSFFTFLEISTPPFTYFFLLGIFFYLAVFFLVDSSIRYYSRLIWTTNMLLLFFCLALGLRKIKMHFRIYKNLLFYVPVFVLWRVWNVVRGFLKDTRTEWIRSNRG